MQLLVFDMDGVLLQAKGYHRALQETVRLAGESLGREANLTEELIARFEALGISAEWHSSALCRAVIELDRQRDAHPNRDLDLSALFELIAAQPMCDPAILRAERAVSLLAESFLLPSERVAGVVRASEDIQHSETFQWFQNLVLGSAAYQQLYQRPAPLACESYLLKYDQRCLSAENAERIMTWAAAPDKGAAIMTNRPSAGPPEAFGTSLRVGAPDAGMGASMLGLTGLPLAGNGEITWLAEDTGREPGSLNKPHPAHALAAILAASGWGMDESLFLSGQEPFEWQLDALSHLGGSEIIVFEDTPGGILAVEAAARQLGSLGIETVVRKIGIADDKYKRAALEAVGAVVYPEINAALAQVWD